MTIDDRFEIDSFQLMSGAPIQVPGLELKIYQPRLFEVAEIGEEKFYRYLSYFRISKEVVLANISDPDVLLMFEQKSEYDILKMVLENEPEIEIGLCKILELLIKNVETIKFNPFFIYVKLKSGQQLTINPESFLIIKDIIYQIFNIEEAKQEFNPSNEAAADIVEKINQRRKKLSAQGKKDQSTLADFVSILAVGLHSLDMKQILSLTIYQVFNIIKRFGMYSQYNMQVQAMMQGAEDVELVDWMKKI